ncbi:histidine--tRNA ligase [Gallicola sp. Sow4_E12]|uniref:histidine--tRNA ligase n=1 Tax=Gallicola sp. Sow4_E12 TaxID=3438785 RepID=UPI003F8E9243
MILIQPSILPGMMELIPEDQLLFNDVKNIIESTFQKYAFLPIDTPVMEKLEILLAKGGGETQKQIYRLEKGNTEIGLRFDLTVPLARYVAQHFSDLNFPFRRYHIGKVYRGERNQKGRYREFYQCDIDIIGHEKLSIYNDAEIPSVMAEIFRKLQLDFTFHYNNRKVMNGLFKSLDLDDFTAILRIIDKINKIGEEGVREELEKVDLDQNTIDKLLNFIHFKGSNEETIDFLKELDVQEELFREGLEELEFVYRQMLLFNIPSVNIKIDLSITRGLDYYTGSVFETFLKGHEEIGSVCSGGRYDDLASNYTKQKLPGIGLSIGLTRLFYKLQEGKLLNIEKANPCDALIIPMKGYEKESIDLLNKLRDHDKIVQIYLEGGKMKKQFAYADNLNVPFVIIIGEEEVKNESYSVKDMRSGEQSSKKFEEIINLI